MREGIKHIGENTREGITNAGEITGAGITHAGHHIGKKIGRGLTSGKYVVL